MRQGSAEELLLRMNDAVAQVWAQGVPPLLSISVGPKHTHTSADTLARTHTLVHYLSPPQTCVFLLTLQFCSVSSHRLVLLPRPLEVHAAVLSALDDRPSSASALHVAVHLRHRHKNEQRGDGATRMALLNPSHSLKTQEGRCDEV